MQWFSAVARTTLRPTVVRYIIHNNATSSVPRHYYCYTMHRFVTAFLCLAGLYSAVTAQRITTIQLDGVQYFVSRMNPYSPELNYFLAYQYCRSLGLQLVSFETKEKADSITQYLRNAGYNRFDFWTSGNKLGTNMLLWMSTGLPFNVTFNYMRAAGSMPDEDIRMESTIPMMAPAVTGRQADGDMGAANGCVVLKSPEHQWEIDDCMKVKDFICEQTRCYYYNYGSIPVSTSQGGNKILGALHVTEKPHSKFDEGHLLNFTRRVTLRPALMRKDDKQEEEAEANAAETTTSDSKEEDSEEQTTLSLDTFHDALLGKVSRSRASKLPTVDRLERKISSSWIFNNPNNKH